MAHSTPRRPRFPHATRAAVVAVVAAGVFVLTAVPARAQIVERVPRRPPPVPAVESADAPDTFVGGTLVYASPRGSFANYVNGAFGLSGDIVHAFDTDRVVSIRADLGYLMYGNVTRRQPLGGGALGLINVDVNTSNNIVFGGFGLQLMAPTGAIRPYLTGNIGFSYFFTTSSVEGSQNSQPFAESQNFSDGGFTTMWGGGLYFPLGTVQGHGGNVRLPFSLDLGVQMHKNADIQYLNENSIQVSNTQATPVITPIRSSADFLTFRLGLMFAVR